MKKETFQRNLGQFYLSIVPFLAFIFGITTGHISYKLYLPIWVINVCLMIIAAWNLGAHVIKNKDAEKRQVVIIACLLILPVLITSIFFGMGPPPNTRMEWIATLTEQQVRFSLLILSGTIITFGFAFLNEQLKTKGERYYSQLGFTAIMIAIPLFIFNMTWTHSFEPESFKVQIASGSDKMPDWYTSSRSQIWVIWMVEVILTYFATASFAASLKSVGWFGKTASRIYIIISLLAILFIVLYPLYPASISAYFPYLPLMIPAVPFIMPYYMAINLLKRAGN